MDENIVKQEEPVKKIVNINIRGILIAVILFISGWALGNLQGSLLTTDNSLIIALVIIAIGMAVLLHNKES